MEGFATSTPNFDLPDGSVVVVEVDGFVHLKPISWWDDMSRQNEIVIGGRPVLRFPSVTVRLDPDQVVGQLRRMRLAHLST
jgi:very-short-patch-repair endonuclease